MMMVESAGAHDGAEPSTGSGCCRDDGLRVMLLKRRIWRCVFRCRAST